jgi:CRP-like cAMP-binding protein
MITFDLLRREPDIRKYRQGETIFKQGDAADCMFAVVEGAIDIELEGAVIERVLPVTVFGEMALIDALPRSATARAASDCSLAVVDQQRFLRLVELTPYFALHMMQLITARLRRVNPH